MRTRLLILLLIIVMTYLKCSHAKTASKKTKTAKANKKRFTRNKSSNNHIVNVAKKKHKNNFTNTLPKCPNLVELFTLKRIESKQKCKLTQCDVTVQKEQCTIRTVPKKQHCLMLRNLVTDMVPVYKIFLNRSRLSSFENHGVHEITLNTCSNKLTFTTLQEGSFSLIPGIMNVTKVEASITLLLPFGDYSLLGAGEWELKGLRMKIKFMRESPDQFNIKGYSEKELIPISKIGEIFDVDILPSGPMKVLLKNILENMLIRDCRVYGFAQPSRQKFELAFSGEPNREEFFGSRIRVFITNSGLTKNLAVLLELQDFSPVTLLKKIYGPSITRATILRDRNQTIALYMSAQPTSKFSSTFMAHGSARWIHRDSQFDPGVYMLVTVPFPKRKAIDMKIKLEANTLNFHIPENEKLYTNLALESILPEKIMHIGVDREAEHKNKDDSMYSNIRILKLKYFIFNNTYIAATESHMSLEEELGEILPVPKPVLRKKDSHILENIQRPVSLDEFFKQEEWPVKDEGKRNSDKKEKDMLSMAKEVGLL